MKTRQLIQNSGITFLVICLIIALSGCDKNFLTENPKDRVSSGIFWKTEKDATGALMGVYRGNKWNGWWNSFNGWNIVGVLFSADWTDVGSNKESGSGYPAGGIISTSTQVSDMWSYNYMIISRANNFLENIGNVNMDETRRSEMIAEVRFLRAYSYFWLSQLYGNVPLITKVLTFEEANSVTQSPQDSVVDFAINELTEAAEDLPVQRPPEENGRIEKGAALALKGRLLMASHKWSEAAETYKKIIDLNRYSIDSRFKELFEESGDNSNEIIFARKYTQGSEFGEPITQQDAPPGWYGGYTQLTFYQSFVDMFLMTDGKPIDQSTLYDPKHPFDNRDPRLYATVLLPDYSVVNGRIYRGSPDSTTQTGPGVTGYGFNKFWDHNYAGNKNEYGGDYPLIRYAEVLLSYLESEVESGSPISQSLLDETINKVRGRASVAMPPVSETNPDKLMEIIMRERAVEFACEGGIRYWDLVRWKKASEALNRDFYGMKITDDPANYTGKYKIDDEGHIFIRSKKTFHDYNYLWPIPQSDLDVNHNLKQNSGY